MKSSFKKSFNGTFLMFIILFILLGVFGYAVNAQTDNSTTNADAQQADLKKQISDYENKIQKLENNAKSLQNEIALVSDQIQLTQLRIRNSNKVIFDKEEAISKLSNDISDLGQKIEKLGQSIVYQGQVLQERMRAKYKAGEISPFMVLFGSKTLNDLVKKSEYLTVMGLNDKKLVDDMSKTKEAFAEQKSLFEDTKQKEVDLKAQLENERTRLQAYKDQLDDRNNEKQQLLKATQNDEAKYKTLLAEAQKELDQITGAVGVLKNTKPRDVKQGELIGYQGSTGHSSGDHLHFGVYKYDSFSDIDGWNWYYSNVVNPGTMLKSKEVHWISCSDSTKNVGSGSWSWPMSGPITITNSYGINCYRYSYNLGREHPALDMVGPYGSPVYAAQSGKAYFCKNCLGDGGNGVFIFHSGGLMSLYWHLRNW